MKHGCGIISAKETILYFAHELLYQHGDLAWDNFKLFARFIRKSIWSAVKRLCVNLIYCLEDGKLEFHMYLLLQFLCLGIMESALDDANDVRKFSTLLDDEGAFCVFGFFLFEIVRLAFLWVFVSRLSANFIFSIKSEYKREIGRKGSETCSFLYYCWPS